MNRITPTLLFSFLLYAASLQAQDPLNNPSVIPDLIVYPPAASSVEPSTSLPYGAVELPAAIANQPGFPTAKNFSPAPTNTKEPVGKGSGLWKWTPIDTHHESIVEVSTSGGSGTGVLISVNKDKPIKDGYEGYVLTAWHVVQDDIVDGSIKVTYRSERRARGCRVVQHDEAKDVAVLWVWVPGEVNPAKLATKSVERGDKLELAGLGGGTDLASCIRTFEAFASPPSSFEKIFADVPLLPGDSGGPVFNANHEVVGIISGGWFWWDSGLKTSTGSYIRTTWPARASNVGPIQSMMEKLKPENRIAEATTQSENR